MRNSTDKKYNSLETDSTSKIEAVTNIIQPEMLSNTGISSTYTQEQKRPSYDNDVIEIVEVVRILNNMAPFHMPVYNFNIEEINGEYYYRPDGSLLLIREFDSDLIRDYYVDKNNPFVVNRVLEHDKESGRLKAKIEPTNRQSSKLKTNITIFDWKINNKYTLFQLTEEGTVASITEFTGKGKSFKTLFRDTETLKPVRYLEGKDTVENGFEMLDCIFDATGKVARIKKFSSKKEVSISYTDDKKNITVKNK